jgi:hypothetical protein
MSCICSETLRAVPGSPVVGEGVAAPLALGLSLFPRFLPNRLRLLKPKLLLSVDPVPIKYAAVWRAVAAAARRAKWDLAFASFVAQSGRTLSVVITVEALAEIDIVRLLCVLGEREGLVCELREVDDDIAEEKPASPWFEFAYTRPLRNGGGSYVTPNSDC